MALLDVAPFRMSFRLKAGLLFLLAFGVLCLHLTFQESKTEGWFSYLLGTTIFIGLGLGGLFFTAIQHIVSARWSTSLRRVMESMALTLPVAALLGIGIYFGIHSIYEWSHTAKVAEDALLQGKSPFLNEGFFTIRLIGYFVIWVLSALFLTRNSFKQDQTGDVCYTHVNKKASALVLVLFALTTTLAGFDLLMSLEPHWFSTMFGVYFFAMFFQASLAVMIILTWLAYRSGVLKDFINIDHFYELGKLLYGFSVFWWYIAISQFLLIWYANLPEETFFYLERFKSGWGWVVLAVLIIRFVMPLLILLPYGNKRNFKVLIPMSFVVLAGHFVELTWIVKPAMRLPLEMASVPAVLDWKDIGIGLGFFALFFLVVGFIMEKVRMVPVGDPRLQESIHHHV